MTDRSELKALALRVLALPVREETDGGTFCAQYEQRRIAKAIRCLASAQQAGTGSRGEGE